MIKLLSAFIVVLIALQGTAQTTQSLAAAPYGKVDMADLEMKNCEFEKDANAEVLFDKGNVYQALGGPVTIERHVRIKIFNDFGKKEGDIKITYPGTNNKQIVDIDGETFTLKNGKVEITKLDNKLVYFQNTDRFHSTIAFSLPNVQAGSVIEFKLKWRLGFYPNWYFQSYLPTRYSEIEADLPATLGTEVKMVPRVRQPFVVDEGKTGDFKHKKALSNIHSLPDEVFMGARRDNLQRIEFLYTIGALNSWEKIGDISLKISQFSDQLDMGLSGDGAIIKQAKALKSDNEKIAFIYDTVKKRMTWNKEYTFYSNDGVSRAWNNKSGTSGEINIILYHLLKKTGIKAYPMLTSSKKNGRINPVTPSVELLNTAVVFIPIDTSKYYVLDATDKYNLFNTVPNDQLNAFGLSVDEDNKKYEMVFMQNEEPAIQSVFINAEIKPGGRMTGTAEINSFNYNKTQAANRFKTDGEEKFIRYLRNDDNNLKISSMKLDGMEVDSLPLTQKLGFDYELQVTDGSYAFVKTNLFTLTGKNVFTGDERQSDIDLGYRDNYSISGIYKVPVEYKTDVLPKSTNLVMPDGSITFRRTIAEENGTITVRYVLNHKKIFYSYKDYPDLQAFYKKMYELLNEQIVLKKA